MENNPQVKDFDLGFVVTYDLFLSAAFQDLFKPVSQVQWYKASRAHPTNPRVWAFTTNRTANYLPGNSTCVFDAKIDFQDRSHWFQDN